MATRGRPRSEGHERGPELGKDHVVSPCVCDPYSDESLEALVHQASASAGWTERNARYLLDKVDELITVGTWPRRLPNEPRTWKRFCADVLGYDAGYIEHIRQGVCVLQERGIHSPTVGDALTAVQVEAALEEATQREPGNSSGRNQHVGGTVDNVHVSSAERPAGNSRARALRRLRQQWPELHARVLAGDMSPHAAAIEAGFRTRMVTVPLDPVRAATTLRKHFSPAAIRQLIGYLEEEQQH